jgi:hypothetical protein
LNVPPFIQAPVNRWQKSTSYFPYIMYNTKKIRMYRDVQYGKNTASGCTIRKNNVRSHVLNGCFWLDENYSCIIIVIIILRVSFCSDIWYCNILAYYPVLDVPINPYFYRIVHYVREVTHWFLSSVYWSLYKWWNIQW